MRILAIDLGKFRFTAVLGIDSHKPARTFRDLPMSLQQIHDLVTDTRPDLVVIEVCPAAGAIADLLEPLGVTLAVLNTCDERVVRRDSKAKTDFRDALRLLELAHARPDDLPLVHMPCAAVRRWRRAIGFRSTLQARLVAAKNSLRSIFFEAGVHLPGTRTVWAPKFRAELVAKARILDRESAAIALAEIAQIELLETQMKAHVKTLDEIAARDLRVARLRTIFGVGPRVAEAFVAWVNDADRFDTGKKVGSYFGLAPRVHASGESLRHGSITRSGSTTVRWLLVQAAWVACRKKGGWAERTATRISGGTKARRRVAVTAVARQLAVRMWAMLRDGTDWREPDAHAQAREAATPSCAA